MYTRRHFILLTAIALLSSTSALAQETSWADIEAAAKQEGSVTVYVGINTSLTEEIAKSFQERYGIQVNILSGRAPEIRERLRTEAISGNQTADVAYMAMTTALPMQEEFFAPLGELPNVSGIDPQFDFLTEGEMLVPAQISSFGILANTQLVSEADMPTSWTDLLDPKWEGKILYDDPRTNGGGNIFFGVTLREFGREFHEKLAAQNPVFSKGYPESERRTARGEFAFFIPDTMTSVFQLQGLPVKMVLPEEGVPYTISCLAVVKDAPHPNAARLFINYFLEGESLPKFAELGFGGPIPGMADSADESVRAFLQPKLLGTVLPDELDSNLALAAEIYK